MKATALFVSLLLVGCVAFATPIYDTGSLDHVMDNLNCKRVALMQTGPHQLEAWECPLMFYVPFYFEHAQEDLISPKGRQCEILKTLTVKHPGTGEMLDIYNFHCGHEDYEHGILMLPFPRFHQYQAEFYFENKFRERFRGYYH